MISLYKYTPLHKEALEIRLISMLPGTLGTEMHIELETAVLSDSQVPTYETLSYTGSSTESPVDICIEGGGGDSRLAVTLNLEESLQYLRYNDDGERVLSIDVVCVD